jgi:tRNA nucleotidyltransferase (CCA-adding enzyme)
MKVITTHTNADFDALSSMLAARKLYPDAVLAFPGSQEKSVRDFLIRSTLYFLDITKSKEIDYDAVDTLILVDTKHKSRIGDFARLVDSPKVKIHVYDHHPPAEDDVKADVQELSNTGACITMLISILKQRAIDVTPEEATIMMLGIYEETGSFHFPSTSQADFEAASYLLSKGANINIVSEVLVKELSPEQVFVLHDLIESADVYSINGVDIVITEGSSENYVGDLAVIVQKFRDMENLNVVFALFRMDDRIYIIGRSRIPEVDVGQILSLMGGGGHKEAASSTVKDTTLIEAKGLLIKHLHRHVKTLREAQDIMFFPVKVINRDAPIGEAKEILTKYNINVLPVTSGEHVLGIITRQVVEKAVFHELQCIPVKEYMITEFSFVSPHESIDRVKEIIIGGNQRFVPVLENGKLVGAITRTDLLRILEDEIRKTVLGKLEYHDIYEKRKNVKKLMQERLSEEVRERLTAIGRLADDMSYHAYLVGGIVRDLLLRNETYDIDIVIEGDGIRFAEEMVKRFGVKIRPHKEFGTANVLWKGGFKVDIATARLEYYKEPAALPVVEHSSLKLDLYRRDFTINTLAISLNKNTFGELIDFFGAQRDIKEKTIRVLHSLSFVEDPTRVFRAIRFQVRFGFHMGKYTTNLIKNAIKMGFLSKIQGQRVWHELSLILTETAPGPILKTLQDFDLLKYMYPHLTFDHDKEALFAGMDTVLKWYNLLYKGKCNRTLYYLFALTDRMTIEDVAGLAAQLEMPESTRKKLLPDLEKTRSAMGKLATGITFMKKSEVYTCLEGLPQEGRLFIMAKTSSEKVRKAVSNYITYADSMKPVVGGRTLKLMGIKEGPVFGEILDALKKAKIDRNLGTKEEEVSFVHDFLREKGITA